MVKNAPAWKRQPRFFQLFGHFLLNAFAHLPAEEGLGVKLAGFKFQVQFEEGVDFADLGARERVARKQWLRWVGILQVLDDDGRLAQRALWRLQVGHFAQGGAVEVGLSEPAKGLFKGDAFFKQC